MYIYIYIVNYDGVNELHSTKPYTFTKIDMGERFGAKIYSFGGKTNLIFALSHRCFYTFKIRLERERDDQQSIRGR